MTLRARRLLLVVLGLTAPLVGCGQTPVDETVPMTREAFPLTEIGEMYLMHQKEMKRPPGSMADLEKYAIGFPIGLSAIQDGEVLVLWGTALDSKSGTSKVLAFEATALERGGPALMQDAATIKDVTAEELKAQVPPEALKAATRKPARTPKR